MANGRRMPMTNSVVVDQVAALDLIDQLRVAVPEEIRQGADSYAASVLVKLEGECVKALQSIRRGLALLDERYPGPEGDPVQPGATPEYVATDERAHAQL